MTSSKHLPAGKQNGRDERIRNVLDTVDDRHEGSGRAAVNGLLGSFRRICLRAQDMLDRDDRWRVRENASADEVIDVVFDSVRESDREYRRWRNGDAPAQPESLLAESIRSPHPLGAVAEQLVAKTLATFAGREAVQDLSKWTTRAESKIARRTPPAKS